jgi:hypothetical protein
LFQAVDFLLHGGDVRDITGMSNHRQQGGRYVLSGCSGGLNCFKQLLPQFLQVLVLVFGQVEIGARGGGCIIIHCDFVRFVCVHFVRTATEMLLIPSK